MPINLKFDSFAEILQGMSEFAILAMTRLTLSSRVTFVIYPNLNALYGVSIGGF